MNRHPLSRYLATDAQPAVEYDQDDGIAIVLRRGQITLAAIVTPDEAEFFAKALTQWAKAAREAEMETDLT